MKLRRAKQTDTWAVLMVNAFQKQQNYQAAF